jgi:hypothetical protein
LISVKSLKLHVLWRQVPLTFSSPRSSSGRCSGSCCTPRAPLNELLRRLGLNILALSWLGDKGIALFSLVAVVLWKNYASTKPAEQTTAQPNQKKPMKDEDKPRLEEKYGFTSEQAGP